MIGWSLLALRADSKIENTFIQIQAVYKLSFNCLMNILYKEKIPPFDFCSLFPYFYFAPSVFGQIQDWEKK